MTRPVEIVPTYSARAAEAVVVAYAFGIVAILIVALGVWHG